MLYTPLLMIPSISASGTSPATPPKSSVGIFLQSSNFPNPTPTTDFSMPAELSTARTTDMSDAQNLNVPRKMGLPRLFDFLPRPRMPDLKTPPPDIDAPRTWSGNASKQTTTTSSTLTPLTKSHIAANADKTTPLSTTEASTTSTNPSEPHSSSTEDDITCAPSEEDCGGICIDTSTRNCCPSQRANCHKDDVCVSKQLLNGTTVYGCIIGGDEGKLSVTLSGSGSEKTTATIGNASKHEWETTTGNPTMMNTTATSEPTSSSSNLRLWQPPKSAGKNLGVPKMFQALMLLRAAAACSISAPAILTFNAPANAISTTSSTTKAIYATLESPSFSAKQFCCPRKRDFCNVNDFCANATQKGVTVWGCAPPDSTDGRHLRIRTVLMETASAIVTTTTTRTPSSTSTMTITPSGSGLTSQPTGSGGSRLDMQGIFQTLVFVVQNVRAITYPSPVDIDCCGGICCTPKEVCARSSTGPRCWPQAGRLKPLDDIANEVDTSNQDTDLSVPPVGDLVESDDTSDNSSELANSKAAGVALVPAAVGYHHKSSAARPSVPIMFNAILLLVSFAAAIQPRQATKAEDSTAFIGTPQLDPATEISSNKRWLVDKRWSCHKPKQNCGIQGCWNPAIHYCCQKPDGFYGLCMAGAGEACCGSMCCPKDMECRNEGEYLCWPKGSPVGKADENATMNTTEADDVVGDKSGGGRGGDRGSGNNAAGKLSVMIGPVIALAVVSLSLHVFL